MKRYRSKPIPKETHGTETIYVVRTFHNTQPPRTWHSGTLASCRAWVKANLTPHPGAPPHGIYKRESTWRYSLIEGTE